ncbi:hypothetical protein Tco_0751341 [Tanacetum coccineum]|uniref:Uncharacterized protein n=1 Tax=Tanacetum coccineum TaxID=301880 RepID=A0ABQ4Z4S0_9ASTR
MLTRFGGPEQTDTYHVGMSMGDLGPVWGCDRLVSRAKVIENQVMDALVISISSDTSEECVGSHAPQVILFGTIPAIIPIIPEVPIVLPDLVVTPEVGAVSVVSPAGILYLVDYSSSSDSDPSEDSLPPAPDLPLSFPLHLLLPHLGFIDVQRLLSDPRHVSHHSSDRYSSPDSSSSSAPSDHSLSGRTPPDTTDADSSTPQRFVHRSLTRTPRHSEAFRRCRSAPLFAPYPPTTSESSLGSSSERSLDSSSPSPGPSHKRCRSPTALVPLSTHVSRSIAPTPVDLLPPRKRFRDSYSPEDSKEEHIEVATADAEAVADVGISEGVVAHPEDGVGMGFKIDVREDDEEFEAEASAANMREIIVDPLAIGDTSESSRGETSQLVASGERASLVERIRSLRLEYLKI